jgi:quercetin dioxygenase-like cupin family protein
MQSTRTDQRLQARKGVVTMHPPDIVQRSWSVVPTCPGVHVRQLNHDGDVTVSLIRYAPTAQTPGWPHPAAVHHICVLSGVALVAGQRLVTGSYVFVPAGVAHPIVAVGTAGCTLLQIHIAWSEAGETPS